MNRFSRVAVSATVALSIAGAAQAASVTINSVQGSWVSVEGGKNVTGRNTSEIRWGTSTGSGKSGYGFSEVGGMPNYDVKPDTAFDLGVFTHYNNEILAGGSITGASLKVDINLSIGGRQERITTYFDFDHWETLNQASTCGNGGANGSGVNSAGCADRVTAVTNLGTSETFLVDGDEYAFTISGFDGLTEFWTTEDQENSAMLRGQFTLVSHGDIPEVAPVPLPAAAWLLGAGVAGLAVAARRRRRD